MSGDDPNSHLFGGGGEEAMDFVYGLNPNRVSAMHDLWYDRLQEQVSAMGLEGEARDQMVFKLTAQSVLDMLGDAMDPERAPEVMSDFDLFLGIALTNRKHGVNLMEEQRRALRAIEPSSFGDEEGYLRALSDCEDAWWDIPQPKLGGRNPGDALAESLKHYGLDE